MKTLLFILFGTGVAMAQGAGTGPSVSLQDSTGLGEVASQQYNFYFSQEQADHFVQISTASYTQEDQIKKYRFRDRTYTQRVAKGVPLPDGFDDYVWIGVGILTEVKQNGAW